MATDDNIHSSSSAWVLTGYKYRGPNARTIQVMRSTGGPLTIPADHRALLRIADLKLEFLGKERNDNVTV